LKKKKKGRKSEKKERKEEPRGSPAKGNLLKKKNSFKGKWGG